jgi:predicted translin family RNA/ssDNA-binding protein
VDLKPLAADIQRRFDEKMAAREKALPAARRAVRSSANAIRAIHRGEAEEASRLMEDAAAALREGQDAVAQHPDVRFAGFLHDAQKEYAEARLTEAVIGGSQQLPGPDALGVTPAAYLNGISEAIGECRRAVLDLLRHGEVARAEAHHREPAAVHGRGPEHHREDPGGPVGLAGPARPPGRSGAPRAGLPRPRVAVTLEVSGGVAQW